MRSAVKPREQFLPANGLPPGVYFGLDEDEYHADRALGSTDIRGIRDDLERWWRGSRFNPDLDERRLYARVTKATVLGKAMHKLVLEGRDVFEGFYVRRPDDIDGATPAEKGALTKRYKAELLSHQFLLHGDEWDLCERTGGLIERHPDLSTVLVGAMREVSVFWMRADGIMCKARYDLLKASGIGDLKSIENQFGKPLDRACLDDFLTFRYDIQAEHYLQGRAQMRGLFARGNVFVMTEQGIEAAEQSNVADAKQAFRLVEACAATDYHFRNEDTEVDWFYGDRPRYGFQFIFVQKSVPGVYSFVLSPGNGYLNDARYDIEVAMAHYRTAIANGVDKPPPAQWRVHELAHEEAPAWWQYRR